MRAQGLTGQVNKNASRVISGATASRGGLGPMLGAVSPARQAAEQRFTAGPVSKAGLTRHI